MKIYINRAPNYGPWGGGAKFVNAMYEHAEKHDDVELCDPNDLNAKPDIILLAGLDNDGDGISAEQAVHYKMFQPNTKIVLRVNENDARKNSTHMDRSLVTLSRYIDATVFVSNWISDYFERRSWENKTSTVIYNGVDKNIFKPQEKFNNGKINIVTAHWSDNPMKGQDYVEWLDNWVKNNAEYSFTYIGRTKAYIKNGKHIRPLAGKKLGEELGKYDVCVNASRFDPGPNSVIEPISCGIPTYVHSDGGGGVEFADNNHTFSSVDDLKKILLSRQYQQNTTVFVPWEDMVKSYVDFLKHVIAQ